MSPDRTSWRAGRRAGWEAWSRPPAAPRTRGGITPAGSWLGFLFPLPRLDQRGHNAVAFGEVVGGHAPDVVRGHLDGAVAPLERLPPVSVDRLEVGKVRGHSAIGPERADQRGVGLVEDLVQLARGDRLWLQTVELFVHRLLDLRGGVRRSGRAADHEQVRVLGAGVIGERLDTRRQLLLLDQALVK